MKANLTDQDSCSTDSDEAMTSCATKKRSKRERFKYYKEFSPKKKLYDQSVLSSLFSIPSWKKTRKGKRRFVL